MCVNGGLNFFPVRLSSIYLWQLAAVPTDHLHPLIPSPDNTVSSQLSFNMNTSVCNLHKLITFLSAVREQIVSWCEKWDYPRLTGSLNKPAEDCWRSLKLLEFMNDVEYLVSVRSANIILEMESANREQQDLMFINGVCLHELTITQKFVRAPLKNKT